MTASIRSIVRMVAMFIYRSLTDAKSCMFDELVRLRQSTSLPFPSILSPHSIILGVYLDGLMGALVIMEKKMEATKVFRV